MLQPSALQTRPRRTRRYLLIGWLCGMFLFVSLLVCGFVWLKNSASQPRLAPEAEQVLQAQTGLPFQALIPAYLPAHFNRQKVEIRLDQKGAGGEPMLQLVYPTPKGNTLVLQEWLPDESQAVSTTLPCTCYCMAMQPAGSSNLGVEVGPLRVAIKLSAANLLTYEQLGFLLETLGPAANQQVFSRMAEVPVAFNMPTAVQIPLNAAGEQEVMLVVTQAGYNPQHFAVKKGSPVRLVFRQVGQVGCGNDLIIQWGKDKHAEILLASPADKEILGFTPEQAGDFLFNCPHLIYRGVMTVEE
jgi:hypothetical protein